MPPLDNRDLSPEETAALNTAPPDTPPPAAALSLGPVSGDVGNAEPPAPPPTKAPGYQPRDIQPAIASQAISAPEPAKPVPQQEQAPGDMVAQVGPDFRGARGSPEHALGDNEHPPVTEKIKLPPDRFTALEKADPAMHQAIQKASTDVGVPAIDLANLAWASSRFNLKAPGGLMNVSPAEAKQLDPSGSFNPSDPVDNVYLGAVKYKQLADRYGVSTSSALGAYTSGADTIEQMARLSPEDQRKHFPQVFDQLRQLSAPDKDRVVDDTTTAAALKAGGIAGPVVQGEEPPAPRRVPEGRLGLELRSLRPEPGAPTNMAQVDAASAAEARRRAAVPVSEMPNPPTDLAQVDAAGAAGARRRENLELLGRVAARNQPPVSEMQNAPTDIGAADRANTAQMQRSGAIPGMDVEPVRPEFQPPGSQFADPMTGQRVAPLPEPTTTVPEMVRAGGQAVADTARSALAGAGRAMAGVYGPATPSAATYQPAFQPAPQPAPTQPGAPQPTPQPASPPGVDPTTGAALTTALPAGTNVEQLGSSQPPAAPGAPGAPGAPPTAPAPPIPQPKPTPPPAAPTAAPEPTASQLNQQELERIRSGQPSALPGTTPGQPGAPTPQAPQPPAGAPTTAGAPVVPTATTSTGAVTQPAGQGPGVPAVGGPGQTRDVPHVTGSGNMTPQGFISAAVQGGPQGGMRYMVANAPRGMSTNDMWPHVGTLLEQAYILKGDMVGAQRAREYVFQQQHVGSNQALMDAYRAMAVGDSAGAAQFLAKSHAFVPDGSTMSFKVGPNNTLWGQRFADGSGNQPMGGPFQVTPGGIATMLNQTLDPQQFLKTLNAERELTQKMVHDQLMTGVRREGIQTTAETQDLNRAQRAATAEAGQTAATARTQLQVDAANQRAEEANQRMRDIAAARTGQIANARRNALTKEADNYWNPNTNPQDFAGGDMSPAQLSQAFDIHAGMRTATPDLQPRSAVDFTKNILNNSWSVRPTADGRLAVLDKPNNSGNVRAYLPGSMASIFGRSVGETPVSATPQPPQQGQPRSGAVAR